jgi:putative aldouronate transport system permease protein
VGTLMSLTATALLAYPLAQRVPGVRYLSLIVYFTILFSGGIIPTYVIVRQTGLMNTLWSLIIPQVIWPFYVIIMVKFFRNIPDSLAESAKIDGANDAVILVRIILPLSLPALASVSLFYAVRYWNEFFTAVIDLSDRSKWTLQVILRSLLITQLEDQFDQPTGDQTAGSVTAETVKMATVMVGTVPIMLIYPFLQKHFARGVLIGAVKG